MKLNIHEAKTHFSRVVAAVEAGERVVICRNGEPVIECVPVRAATAFPFGAWASLLPAGQPLAHLADPTDPELLDAMGL
jgi:prevent-host-death family protein